MGFVLEDVDEPGIEFDDCELTDEILHPEFTCPTCNSPHVEIDYYDATAEAGTGYSDAGMAFRCLECLAIGPAEDAGWKPEPQQAVLPAVEDDWEMARRAPGPALSPFTELLPSLLFSMGVAMNQAAARRLREVA